MKENKEQVGFQNPKFNGLVELNIAQGEAKDAKGVLVIMHGLGEHINRYAHVFDFFNQNGYHVLGCDFLGHGKSSGKKGHIPGGIDTMMDIIHAMVSKAEAQYPGLPVFLFGHSMGGCGVINYLMRKSPKIKGVIASAPALRLAFEPPKFLVMLGRLTLKLMPSFTQPNNLDRSALSRDPKVVEAYSNDPLVHGVVSSELGLGLLDAGRWATQNIAATDLSSPLLVYHGTADRLTSAEGTKEFAAKAKSGVDLKLWDGFYHESHNEPEQGEVLKFILDWMNKK